MVEATTLYSNTKPSQSGGNYHQNGGYAHQNGGNSYAGKEIPRKTGQFVILWFY